MRKTLLVMAVTAALLLAAGRNVGAAGGTGGPLRYMSGGGETISVCVGVGGTGVCPPVPAPVCPATAAGSTPTCFEITNAHCDPAGTSEVHWYAYGVTNLGPFTARGYAFIGPQTMPAPPFYPQIDVGSLTKFHMEYDVDGPLYTVQGVADLATPPPYFSPTNFGACTADQVQPGFSGITFDGRTISFANYADYHYTAHNVVTNDTQQYEGAVSGGGISQRGTPIAPPGYAGYGFGEFNEAFVF